MDLFFINIAHAESLDKFISNVENLIINPTIILLFALAVVYFLWGLFDFLSNPDSEEKRTKGKSHMLFGVLGISIMMGVWTILRIVTNTINIGDDGNNPSGTNINPKEGTVHLKDYTPSKPTGFLN